MNKKLLFLGLALLSGAIEVSAAASVARAARNGASQGRILLRRINSNSLKEQINSNRDAASKALKSGKDSNIPNLTNKEVSQLSPEANEYLKNLRSDPIWVRDQAIRKEMMENDIAQEREFLKMLDQLYNSRKSEFADNIKFSIAAIALVAGLYGYNEWERKKLKKKYGKSNE